MDSQGSNFLSGDNTFGIQQASIISNETADLIYGGVSSNITPIKPKKKPTAAQPIIPKEDEEDNDHHTNRDPFPIEEKLSADELLDSLGKPIDEDVEEEEVKPPVEKEDELIIEDEGSTFGDITKELIKMGIFKQRDEDDSKPVKTGEDLKERFIRESEETANEKIYNFLMSKHGQEGLDMFDAMFVKGVPIKDYLRKFDQLQTFKDMDLSNEDNQKRVYREAYRRQGLAEDKIEKKLQKSIDYGDLEEETVDLHEILVKQEEDEHTYMIEESAAKEDAKKQRKAAEANNYQAILGTKLKEKDFDGVPVTDKIARETYDYLTTERWQLPGGEKISQFDKDIIDLKEDPKNHELRVKMALLLRNKLDLTKVKSKAVSAEASKVFDNLVKRDTQIKRTNKTTPPTHSFLDGLH